MSLSGSTTVARSPLAGRLGRSVGCGSFFNLKRGDLSIQFGEKLGFALKTNRNRKFDPLLNVFDAFCIHTDA